MSRSLPAQRPFGQPLFRFGAGAPLALAFAIVLLPAGSAEASASVDEASATTLSVRDLGFDGLAMPSLLGPSAQPPANPEPSGSATAPPRQPDTSDAEPNQTEPDDAREEASTFVRGRSVPPFWIDRTYTTHRTRALTLPPLFVHRTPTKDHPEKFLHLDLALTFGWYSRASGRKHWLSAPGLFYGYYSERKSFWAAAPLLMAYRRVGQQFNFGQFPLVWWWGNRTTKNFLFIPFHYQKKSPDGFQGVSALLFWYGNKNLGDADMQNDRRHFVAAPVFWRFRRGLKQFDYGLIYVGGFNRLKGLEYRSALPFFWWQRSEFGNRKEFWSLPWVRRVDEARGRRSWAVPLALTFGTHNPRRSFLMATPLFWRAENHLRDSRLTIAGPVGVYDDPHQRNAAVAPFWFRFGDKQANAKTDVFVPLGWSRRSPERTAVWTWVAGGFRSKNGWGFGIPPLLTFAGRNDRGTSWQGILGAFWHVRRPALGDRPSSDTWVAGPLAYARRRGERKHFGIPPLLTFAGWSKDSNYQVVTPLFWHVRDKAEQRRTLVLAPFYHHKTKAGFDGGLPPVVFYGNSSRYRYGIVPWLLTGHVYDKREQRALTFNPLFVRSKAPDHRTLGILGLAWDVKRHRERHTLVLPFVYRRNVGDRTWWVTPIGGSYRKADSQTALFGPVYVRRGKNRLGVGVLPFLFHNRRTEDGAKITNTAVVPLYFRHRGPRYDLDMYTPLVWRSKVGGERPRKGFAFIPFYFRQRQEQGVDVDAGPGFVWARNSRRRTHTIIAGPAFHRLSRTALNAGVVPLYWWHDDAEKRRLLALPLIVHVANKADQSHTTIAPPFWFDRKQANGRRGWAAFPFVFGGRRLHNFTRFSLVPPGYVDIFRVRRNARFTGFVPLLFRYQKCGFQANDDPSCRYELWGSFPLFLYGRDGQGRRTHASLVYYFDRNRDGYRLYTPLFGLRNEPGKVLSWYAGPIGVRTTQTHRNVLAFPLYFRRAHRIENESLTLVAPPLFIGRNRGDRRFFEAGLVVWQFRQPHKVSTAVLPPVFFHSHAYAQRKLTWLLPLFYRDNHMAADRTFTTVLPGLYVQRRRGEDLDFVQFPLVWHIERGANQGTFGAFAWWDIRVQGKTFQMVPGAYFRWATPEHDTKVVGPGLGWWTNGPQGELQSWRILFGLFGAGIEDGRKYVTVFGAKVRTRSRAEARKARLLRRARRLEARRDRLREKVADGAGRMAQRRLRRLERALVRTTLRIETLARSSKPQTRR